MVLIQKLSGAVANANQRSRKYIDSGNETPEPQFVQSDSNSSRHSRISDSSDLQRELRAFTLLPSDQGNQVSEFGHPDLRVMIRREDVELSDQSHQERLHLDDAIREAGLSVSREIG